VIAVVTGGSGGLGRAIVAALQERGYDVRDWSRTTGVDAADEDQVAAAAAGLGRWDVLVNNAALLVPRLVTEMTLAEWEATIGAGLRSAFVCSRAAFRQMRAGGTIVNVSSLSGWAGAEKFPRMAAYVAAKSGLAGLTEALAVEGRELGLRVNAVSPGSIDTPMLALSGAPRDPALQPPEVARVVAWLASEDSRPLTGANLRIDPWRGPTPRVGPTRPNLEP
jgi:NAD(P)-dependent dehydrogenase (short-subunit alcohol dehydrogenase family)